MPGSDSVKTWLDGGEASAGSPRPANNPSLNSADGLTPDKEPRPQKPLLYQKRKEARELQNCILRLERQLEECVQVLTQLGDHTWLISRGMRPEDSPATDQKQASSSSTSPARSDDYFFRSTG